jgi:hypothetical protein
MFGDKNVVGVRVDPTMNWDDKGCCRKLALSGMGGYSVLQEQNDW